MIAAKTRSIDGVEYTVTTFPARRGFQLKIALLKRLAPGLAGVIGAIGRKGGVDFRGILDLDIKPDQIARGVAELFSGTTPEDALDLVMQLLSDTRRGGREITPELFDSEFAGDYGHLYKVLAFVVDVNWGKMLRVGGGVAGIIGRVGGEQEQQSTKPESDQS